MDLWIIATLAAALFQTGRFMLQKHLSTQSLSASGATFARFVYSAPVVVIVTATYLGLSGTKLPALNWTFWSFGAAGGAAQVVATVLVVALFKQRNFAVGISFKKTEVLQTVLVGLLVLGETVTPWALAAILIGLAGVFVLSGSPARQGQQGWRRLFNGAAGLGLLSGVFFAISGVCYRGASLELASDAPLLRAAVTLAAVTSMQLIGMSVWLRGFEPGQIGKVLAAWRSACWIGVSSMAGSFCWFTAFTLQNAAYVNAVGQIELLFSLIASVLFFRETIKRHELIGIGLLAVSIIGLVGLI